MGALAGNVTHLADWSTTEMVTFNLGTLIEIVGGGYLVYWGFGFKKRESNKQYSRNKKFAWLEKEKIPHIRRPRAHDSTRV